MDPTNRHLRGGAPCVVAAVLFCGPGGADEPPAVFGVEAARRLIAEQGPQKTAEQVSSDSPMLEAVAAGVATARHEWLDVGAQLMGGAEAYAYLKERLIQAFSEALLRDAAAVLERGASGVPLESVCGYDPLSALDNPPPRSEFLRAVESRERAVAAVTRADLGPARASCLAALTRLRTVGAQRYAP